MVRLGPSANLRRVPVAAGLLTAMGLLDFVIYGPLIVIVTLRIWQSPRLRAGVASLGAALSAVAMAAITSLAGIPSRVYYGTDTHASALLAGAGSRSPGHCGS